MDRARFFFDTIAAAAEALIEVLEFARKHRDVDYRFGPTSAQGVMNSGLWIEGEIEELAATLNKIPGSVQVEE